MAVKTKTKKPVVKTTKKSSKKRKPKTGPWGLSGNRLPPRIAGAVSLTRRWDGDTPTIKGHDEPPTFAQINCPGNCARLVKGKTSTIWTGGQSLRYNWRWDDSGPYPSQAGLLLTLGESAHYQRPVGDTTERETRVRKPGQIRTIELPPPSAWLKTLIVYIRTDESAIIVSSDHTPEELCQSLTRYVRVSVVDKEGWPFYLDYLGMKKVDFEMVKTTNLDAFLARAFK